MLLSAVLGLLLAVSLAANVYQYRSVKKIKREPSWDARQLIADLTRGSALVRIQRISPEDVMLRSARGGI